MRLYKLCFLVLAIVLLGGCKSIQWSAQRPLTWDDFKGSRNGGYAANTNWRVRYRYMPHISQGNYQITFSVQCLFEPGESCLLPGAGTPELLRHEQTHFDLAELYTRQLYRAFTATTYTAAYRKQIKDTWALVFARLKATQEKFDQETEHGLNKPAEAEWESQVALQLQQTPPYPLNVDTRYHRPKPVAKT
jgi:hypothetical protein